MLKVFTESSPPTKLCEVIHQKIIKNDRFWISRQTFPLNHVGYCFISILECTVGSYCMFCSTVHSSEILIGDFFFFFWSGVIV